jgi:hypothetical protein
MKEDHNTISGLIHKKALLQQEQQSKWISQNKLMLLWILICFLATLLASLVILLVIVIFILFIQNSCLHLNASKRKQIKNQENINLIQIIQQDSNSTTGLMTCDVVLRDEFNHI